jgi:hypothetical protein
MRAIVMGIVAVGLLSGCGPSAEENAKADELSIMDGVPLNVASEQSLGDPDNQAAE